ncbi:MAG: hypothetical protein ACR2FS_05610 [Phormidesmis sp.]
MAAALRPQLSRILTVWVRAVWVRAIEKSVTEETAKAQPVGHDEMTFACSGKRLARFWDDCFFNGDVMHVSSDRTR